MKRPPRPGIPSRCGPRTALDASRPRRAFPRARRSADRLRAACLHLQQSGHPRSAGQRRRRRSVFDFDDLHSGDRLRAGGASRGTVHRLDERHARDSLGRSDRLRLHPAQFPAGLSIGEAAADRRLLQQAVPHAREQRFERALRRDQRGDRVPGQVGTVLDFSSRGHRRPAVHAHQSRPQLRAVSASRDPAHRSAYGGRGIGRLRCRLGILQAEPKGMAQGRGGQPACGALREARALVRHLRGDGVDRKRDRPRALCGPVSRRRRSHGRGGVPACARLSGRWGAVPTARAQSSARTEHHRHLLLARVRLRRRRISNFGHERVRAILGRSSAVALVHPDPVRPGRARLADLGDRASVRCPRPGLRLA